jgi:uncharacterized membrane protein (DUF2068 family)
MAPEVTRAPRDVGVRLILAYKMGKAVAELSFAVALVALAASGELATVRHFATGLREHLASRWSVLVGRAIGALVSARGVHLVEIGLALDGLVSAFEGFALWRGYPWAPWLVVAATAAPLPLEIASIVRTHRLSRLALAVVNVVVIGYLARRSSRRRP